MFLYGSLIQKLLGKLILKLILLVICPVNILEKVVSDFFLKCVSSWSFVFLQNELFEKAKNEILDEVISLSQVTPQLW